MTRDAGNGLIEVSELGFNRGLEAVLDVRHLHIARGQAILLTGDNGSGKTTLLKVLAGLLTASRGVFRCLGVPMDARLAARFCRGRHVYLHQSPYMLDASVEENIAYGLRLRGRDRTQMRVEIRDMLAWASLEDFARRRARALSTGEQQRVALTRARVLAPSLLLLDEITANMDAASRHRVCTMITDLKQSGASVVLASHEHGALQSLCDQRLELVRGTLRVAPGAATGSAVVPLHRDTNLSGTQRS